MSEVEQRRDAGMDARGRATQGAVAERLPSERARQAPGAAQRGTDADAARLAKARRNAWVLGGVALAFYVGYMVWFLIRGSIG
jgi:hypothetical protein